MLALAVSGDGVLEPKAARAKKRPVLLVQGGIHAGEIEGKDAGFWVLRELLESPAGRASLARFTLVFVPVFNVDGHERFGPNHRPNQRGPREMGWRTTGQNLNLNRDYAKAEAPEMAAMLELLTAWDPVVYADIHTTDGAQFQHDVSVNLVPSLGGPTRLAALGRGLRDRLLERLKAGGHLPVSFYPEFIRRDDPASGFRVGMAPPRLAHSYWGLRNRFGILLELHSWKTYDLRVKAAADFILALLDAAAKDGAAWAAACAAQDAADSGPDVPDVTLAWAAGGKSRPLEFLGYAYSRTTSSVSGALMTVYDESRPQVWTLPFFDQLKPAASARPPEAGYLVPAAHAGWVAEKLRLHGIAFEALAADRPAVRVSVFRAAKAVPGKESYEGRLGMTVEGVWAPEEREVPRGSLLVPTRQARRSLLTHLFEPAAPDSFLRWGFFNTAFELKEYMEPYVAEAAARDMLKDPAAAADFEKRLREDPAFAADPERRLDYFYRRHPSWDERYNLYPVYRLEESLDPETRSRP